MIFWPKLPILPKAKGHYLSATLLVELVVLERRDEVAVGVYVRGLGVGEGHGGHPESVC